MSIHGNPLHDAVDGRDEQYSEAVTLAKQKASVSFLQRKLLISYHQAEDFLERMIRDGHIADYSGRCLEKVKDRHIAALTARVQELEALLKRKSHSRDCQRPECISHGCFGHCLKASK